jgi:hypothetical protein
MKSFQPKPGFDWSKVNWGRPDSPPSVLCCYCSASLPEDSSPLVMWSDLGFSASFCARCSKMWWGLESSIDIERSKSDPDL